MNHSRSLLRENSFPRKKIVKIKILQTNLQFGDFLRENHEFYYTCVACSGIKNVIKKTYGFENLVLFLSVGVHHFGNFSCLKAYFFHKVNNRIMGLGCFKNTTPYLALPWSTDGISNATRGPKW